MTFNLHTHTVRCNHAKGEEREYIENAIKAGFTLLGFADHAPYPFPDGYVSWYRMRADQQEDYVSTLLALREEYKKDIEIRIGYEVEYYGELFLPCVERLESLPIDYLLLGQHFINDERNKRYSGRNYEDATELSDYVDSVCAALATGKIAYVAHPDLCGLTGNDAKRDELYTRLILAAKAANAPLEFNLLGFRENRIYPREEFFRLCAAYDAPVLLGSDAHDPLHIYDAETVNRAEALCERLGVRRVRPVFDAPVGAGIRPIRWENGC